MARPPASHHRKDVAYTNKAALALVTVALGLALGLTCPQATTAQAVVASTAAGAGAASSSAHDPEPVLVQAAGATAGTGLESHRADHPIIGAAPGGQGRPAARALRRQLGGNGITYHNGPLITASPHTLYYIWYGNWADNNATAILTNLAQAMGGSLWYNIQTTYVQ
jgi:hypothetical protein